MGIENLMAFIITALFFIMTPGIDTIFVLNKSISQGKKSGFYATLGINTGVLIHTFFAAIGLSVLIAKSVFAFALIKYIGAIYLIYLGFFKLKNNTIVFSTDNKKATKNLKNDFWSGFFTNTLNPKVALFFLAFFPQFINPDKMNNPIPFLILGITYALIGIVWFLILTFFASIFSEKLKSNSNLAFWLNKLSGVIFICMGIKIALSKN